MRPDEQPELPLRIVVRGPPAGVTFALQRGAAELVAPSQKKDGVLVFDFTVRAEGLTDAGTPRFLGSHTQGPPTARFIYVNAGRRAGQSDTCWDRRAKVPLAGITTAMVERVQNAPGARLETEFEGTGPDGGPTCAMVKSIVWRVAGTTAR